MKKIFTGVILVLTLSLILAACGAQAVTPEPIARPSNPGGPGAAVNLTGDATAGAQIYTHRFIFELMLLAQRIGGSITSAERDHWRRWYTERRHRAVDASADPSDPWPGVVHAALVSEAAKKS